MAQIQPPAVFTSGQILTASGLNAHVSSAVLLPGAITDQVDITANTVAATDSLVIHDLSATALREATVSDLLNSGIPVTATTVNATDSVTTDEVKSQANKDIDVIPYAGVAVTGKTFTSGDGITTTISSTAHGLIAGQVISVTASNTAYSGTFRITSVTTDNIVYTLPAAIAAGSGTCSYTKLASVKVTGNEIVTGNVYVDGNLVTTGTISSTGTTTFTGTANFTGALQVNGATGYVLTEVYEETITPWTSTTAGVFSIWTSATFTKPAGEIWVLDIDYVHDGIIGYAYEVALRYASQTARSGQYFHIVGMYDAGVTWIQTFRENLSVVIPVGTAVTNERVAVDVFVGNASQLRVGQTSMPNMNITNGFGGTNAPSVLRIYKYKTA